VAIEQSDQSNRERLTATSVELIVRLGVLGLLLYWSFILVRPFITIAIWSVVLAVALYPFYQRLVGWLGGRRRLAAFVLTLVSLVVVVGPATWLVLSLIDSVQALASRLDPSALVVPAPPDTIKGWPLVGERVYQLWDLASTNLRAALAKIVPQLKPLAGTMLHIGAGAGTGMVKFFIAIVITGFLFSPAPALVDALNRFAHRLASQRGEGFVQLAGATIRAVSRGVIGISALQALLAGTGLVVAGIPGASLLTSAILVLGIIQIGPAIVIAPLIIWSWTAMDTTAALLFTAYMIPVALIDNVLRPLVMARGLATPMPIILIGVIGGTIAYGITGLFLGPIVLAVIWELLAAWLKEREPVQAAD